MEKINRNSVSFKRVESMVSDMYENAKQHNAFYEYKPIEDIMFVDVVEENPNELFGESTTSVHVQKHNKVDVIYTANFMAKHKVIEINPENKKEARYVGVGTIGDIAERLKEDAMEKKAAYKLKQMEKKEADKLKQMKDAKAKLIKDAKEKAEKIGQTPVEDKPVVGEKLKEYIKTAESSSELIAFLLRLEAKIDILSQNQAHLKDLIEGKKTIEPVSAQIKAAPFSTAIGEVAPKLNVKTPTLAKFN